LRYIKTLFEDDAGRYYRGMENLQLESSNHLVQFGSVSPGHQFSSKGHIMKWNFLKRLLYL